MKNKVLFVGIILASIVGLSLSSVYAADLPSFFDEPCTEGSPRDQAICRGVNDINNELEAQGVIIDLLISTQISEQSEQDGMQTDITNLQGDVTTAIIQIDSIMISLNTTLRDYSTGFNVGFGNGTNTIVVSHKTYENANVTVTLEYLESLRDFNNGTERSFQLTDDVLLLGDSKIFIETFVVPLGVLFEGTQGFVESCVILPTEDPNICARTTAIQPGDELKVFFKVDLGGVLTGLNVNQVTTRITSEVIT